jgi:hypothetical protein
MDRGLEFDLVVTNSQTGEEYSDEASMIPRNTQLIVHRLPAARGVGLLAKIARSEQGMAPIAGKEGKMRKQI